MSTASRFRSLAIFVLATLFGVAVAVITVVSSQDHKRDHLVLDTIAHQRELVQQLTFTVIADPQNQQLAHDTDLLEANLITIRAISPSGENLIDSFLISPTGVGRIKAALDQVGAAWQTYRVALGTVQETSDITQAQEDFRFASEMLLAQLNNTSSAISAHMELEIGQVRLMQVFLLVTGSTLAFLGFMIRRRDRFLFREPGAISQPGISERLDTLPILPVSNGSSSNLAPDNMNMSETRQEIAHIRELLTIYQNSQDILQEQDVSSLINLSTEKTRSTLQADISALCLIGLAGTTLDLMAIGREGPSACNGDNKAINFEPMQIATTIEEIANGQACKRCAMFGCLDTETHLSVPLQAGEKTIGAVCVTRQQGRAFDGLEHRALELLARSVGVAISNAQVTEANRHEARQDGVLQERQRVAAELHDNLAQTLSYVNLRAQHVENLLNGDRDDNALADISAIRTATSAAYEQVRVALTGLGEPPTADNSFSQELTDFVASLRESTGLNIDLALNEAAATKLDPLTQEQVLYIAREALVNAAHHAQAGQIWVRLGQTGDRTILVVEDNGRGFQPQDVNSDSHLGLKIMATRAERLGGEFSLESQPGRGTKVMACFPQNRKNGQLGESA